MLHSWKENVPDAYGEHQLPPGGGVGDSTTQRAGCEAMRVEARAADVSLKGRLLLQAQLELYLHIVSHPARVLPLSLSDPEVKALELRSPFE